MNNSDKLAFLSLLYLMPLVWLSIILSSGFLSYLYVQDALRLSVKEDITQHISERFLHANEHLNNTLKLEIEESDLISIQDVFTSKDDPNVIFGYSKIS